MKISVIFLLICFCFFGGPSAYASEFLNALENATSVKEVKPKIQRSTNQKKTVTDPSVSCYPNKDILKVTQKYLYDLGLYKFSIDGVAGKGTRSAIMEAKNLLGARASPGNCLTDQDISEFRLLAEDMWDDTGGSIKKHVFPKTDLDPNETTIRKLQQDLDKKADELTELTERYGIERRVTQGIIENLRADLSASKVQNAGLKLELAAVNKSNKTEFSTVSETMGSSKVTSLALNTQSVEGIIKIAEEPVEGEVSISDISQSIKSVVVQITEPTFDVYSCAFNLEFTNSPSGKSFDVVMYAEGGDGKFTASTKDIQKALANSELNAEDNNWTALSVKAKKYDDPNVVCKPANQNSYQITEGGAEGVFNIDSKGQLTMTDLPIVELGEGRVADELEKLQRELALSNRQLTELRTQFKNQQALLDDPQTALSKEKAISAKARREMALLNQQVAALRTQLQNLQGLLNDELAKNIAEEVRIQNLGSQLNSALARVTAEERKRRRLEERIGELNRRLLKVSQSPKLQQPKRQAARPPSQDVIKFP